MSEAGGGSAVSYGAAATTTPIVADLGEAGSFTGQVTAGTLGGAVPDLYTFSVRASELASSPSGTVILRVAVTGVGVLPSIDGLVASSVQASGGTVAALFAISTAGLFRLSLDGAGGYTLALSFAGDVNLDGQVDGTDGALALAGAAGADVNGDGVVNATDVQLVGADYGVVANRPPAAVPVLPVLMTHVGLRVQVDLTTIAVDPNGDRETFRIVAAQGGTAVVQADGTDLLFTPDAGYTGPAGFTVVADDGFGQSGPISVPLTISAAALTGFDFDRSRILFSGAGASGVLRAYADFADQAHVLVPLDYVDAKVDDPAVVTLLPDGRLFAVGDGATIIRGDRGTFAAAIVAGVGTPTDGLQLISSQFNINPYPGSVTLEPGDATRDIVTRLGTLQDSLVGPADGVRYVSMNSAIATVDAAGYIHAVADGTTTIKVLFSYGEGSVGVQVKEAVVAATATVGVGGGVVENADGIRVGFGAGQLAADATVTITTLRQDQLPIPTVGGDTGAFTFAGAFTLDVNGSAATGAVQIALPAAGAAPGDQVFFFQLVSLPTGANGALQQWWAAVDSGVVDANGIARSASPPYRGLGLPGLTDRATVLVARAAQPTNTISADLGFEAALAYLTLPLLGIAAVVPGAALAVIGLASTLAVLPIVKQATKLYAWQQAARNQDDTGAPIAVLELPVTFDPTVSEQHLNVSLPTLAPILKEKPQIKSLDAAPQADGSLVLTLTAVGLAELDLPFTQLVYKFGNEEITAPNTSYTAAYDPGTGLVTFSNIIPPAGILLGLTQIEVREQLTQVHYDNYSTSPPATIANKAGYTFTGDVRGQALDVIGRPNGSGLPALLNAIPLQGHPKAVLVTQDLSQVFVATDNGIDIIDGLTLKYYGHIDVGGDENVTALAISGDNKRLYAAMAGKVVVFDVAPGDYTFAYTSQMAAGEAALPYTKVSVISVSKTAPGGPVDVKLPQGSAGLITTLALNSDSTRLYVGVPGSRLIGGGNAGPTVLNGGSVESSIYVVNVAVGDQPLPKAANTLHWNQVIAVLDGGLDVTTIIAGRLPGQMLFTSRGNLNQAGYSANAAVRASGFHTITVTDNDPSAFEYQADANANLSKAGTPISLALNRHPIATRYIGLVLSDGTQFGETPIAAPPVGLSASQAQKVDLDIRNASGLAVLSDGSYAFVSDYDLPRVYYENSQLATDDENLHQIGAKIGIIKDPFTNPVLLAATTPIPLGFADNLVLSGDGTKLYALYHGAQEILVFDVLALIAEATKSPDVNFHTTAVDNPANPQATLDPINLPGQNVPKLVAGLAAQQVGTITLLKPSGPVDVSSGSPQPLVFIFKVDIDGLGLKTDGHPGALGTTDFTVTKEAYHANLYVSTQTAGNGLFPSDPASPRTTNLVGYGTGTAPGTYDPTIAAEVNADVNPDRIFSSDTQVPGGLLMGHFYSVDEKGTVKDLGFNYDLYAAHETKLTFSAALASVLTAGQTLNWGVQLQDKNVKASAAFRTAPVAATSAFGTVTVLNSGLQLPTRLVADDTTSIANQVDFDTLAVLDQLAQLIVQADGGGTVLYYDKQKGQWDQSLNGHLVVVNGANLPTGSVVLVGDWSAEAEITDSGFSEAAADAEFAAIAALNTQTGGALLLSKFHFIGIDRGASVNSEIVQRLGTYFPDKKDITLTSLNPTEANQTSLNVPVKKLIDTAVNALVGAKLAADALGVLSGGATKIVGAFITVLQTALEKIETAAATVGIQIDPIQYATLQDPAVQNWNNVAFADTYYTDSTNDSSTSNTLAFAVNLGVNLAMAIKDSKGELEAAAASVKAQVATIKQDAAARLKLVVAAAKTDGQAAFKTFVTDFEKTAADNLNQLKAKASADAMAAFQALVDQQSGTVKAAAQQALTDIVNNTAGQVQALQANVLGLLQDAATQFTDATTTAVNALLDSVTLDNVLTLITQLPDVDPSVDGILAALTDGNVEQVINQLPSIDSLFGSFTAVFDAIVGMTTDTVTAVAASNTDILTQAGAKLGTMLEQQLQDAATKLGATLLADLKAQVDTFFTVETKQTQAAIKNFVAILRSEAVTQLKAEAAKQFAKLQDVIKKTIKVPTFTFTINGQANFSDNVNLDLSQASGFAGDDFGGIAQLATGSDFGLGGPNQRLVAWYAGTVRTDIASFNGQPIDRQLGDTGLRETVFGVPLVLPSQGYDKSGWYYVDPNQVVQRNAAFANAGTPQGNNLIKEGVGAGFFFGPDGGGAQYAPVGKPTKTDVATDNTVAKLSGTTIPAVETVFNGNFQQGIKQSIVQHLLDPAADWGRFPLSYQLPGWSFQGGQGFTIQTGALQGTFGLPAKLDVTGLFVVPAKGAETALTSLVNSYVGKGVDQLAKYLETLFQKNIGTFKLPTPPDPAKIPDPAKFRQASDAFNNLQNQVTQAGTVFATLVQETLAAFGQGGNSDADIQAVVGLINQGLGAAGNAALTAANALSDAKGFVKTLAADVNATNALIKSVFNPTTGKFNPAAVAEFKTFLNKAVATFIEKNGPSAPYGLLFGGSSALTSVLTAAFSASPVQGTQQAAGFDSGLFLKQVVDSTLQLTSVTHDRVYVPVGNENLTFHVYVPLGLTPNLNIVVTAAIDDDGSVTSKMLTDAAKDPSIADNTGPILKYTKNIPGAFFQDFLVSVPVAGYGGHQVLFSITELNADGAFADPTAVPNVANPAVTLADGFSSLFLLEDVGFSAQPDGNEYAVAKTKQVGIVSASGNLPAGGLTLDQVAAAAAEARADWIASGVVPDAAARLDAVGVTVGLLTDHAIGGFSDGTITLDATAGGVGWYTGGADEFTPGPNGTMVAVGGTGASHRFDLVTVLEHEYGHALGLGDLPDGAVPGALMTLSLAEGVRILPSAKDLSTVPASPVGPVVTRGLATVAAVPAAAVSATPAITYGPVRNGSFAVMDPAAPGYAWSTGGSVGFAGGQATLTENRTALSTLSQSFLLGPTQTSLSFTLVSGRLFQDANRPSDTFEVALDGPNGAVMGTAGLSRTDDLLDIQADGTVFLAAGVTVSGLGADGRLDLGAGAHVVTIDTSKLSRSAPLSLDFALVTFGTHPAQVVVSNVAGTSIAGPVAADVTAVATSGVPVLVDVLAADGGTGLVLTSVAAPAHGTAVIQAGGVLYTPAAGYVGMDRFGYGVTDANGFTAGASVAVTVQAAVAVGHPSAASSQVTAVAATVPLLIAAPSDTDFAVGTLRVTLTALPTNGALALADGTPVAGVGTVLTVAQLAGLVFTAAPGAAGITSVLRYTVADPAGATASAAVTIIVPAATITAAPTLLLSTTGRVATMVIADQPVVTLTGLAAAGAVITVSGQAGSTVAAADGSFTLTFDVGAVPATGTRLDAVASATLNGVTVTTPIALWVLPTPDASGIVQAQLVSTDLSTALGAGYRLQLSPGTVAIHLTDGTLSVGTDTLQAYVQRLYEGLFGRSYDPAGLAAQLASVAAGTSLVGVAASFLASDEYVLRGQPLSPLDFVRSLYTGFLGRTALAPDLDYWSGVIAQGLSRAEIVSLFAQTAEAKRHAAAETAEVFARDTTATNPSDFASDGFGQPPGLTKVDAVPPGPAVLLLGAGQTAAQLVVNRSTIVLSGMAAPGAVITLSGGLGTTVAAADGSYSLAIDLGAIPATGLRLSMTATATVAGRPASAASAAASVLALPPPGEQGVVQARLSSKDLAAVLGAGYSLQLSPGTEAISLVDGVLSVGPDTQEAYVQRLFEGLLGRPADAQGLAAQVAVLNAGGTAVDVAANLLGSPEYLARPQPGTDIDFVASLYTGFLGRAALAPDLVYWQGVIAQGLTHSEIVSLFGQVAEAKQHWAFATGGLFGRDATGTTLHELYETVLGREADPVGLATFTHLVQAAGVQAATAQFLMQPEAAALAGQPDAAFVAGIYATGLGRAATAAELSAGTAQLGAGVGRAAFLLGLLGGAEALAHLTSDALGTPVLASATPVLVTEPIRALLARAVVGADAVVADAVAAPSITQSPGQAGSGIPVSFTSGGEATELVFTATFDPALLAVTGVAADAGLPEGAALGFALDAVDGLTRATVTVSAPRPIAAATVPLVRLLASVPATAPSGVTQALTLAIQSVNGVPQALPPSTALQVVGWLDDAGAADARTLRVVGGADSGAAVWSGTAPLVETDAAPNAATLALDAPAAAGGPATLAAPPGGMVTVPVGITQATVLAQGAVTLAFDPAVLELVAVRADPAAGLVVTPSGDGRVTVTAAGSGVPTGVLALFDFAVALTVPAGSALAVEVTVLGPDGQALPQQPDTSVAGVPAATDDNATLLRQRAARARLLAGAA